MLVKCFTDECLYSSEDEGQMETTRESEDLLEIYRTLRQDSQYVSLFFTLLLLSEHMSICYTSSDDHRRWMHTHTSSDDHRIHKYMSYIIRWSQGIWVYVIHHQMTTGCRSICHTSSDDHRMYEYMSYIIRWAQTLKGEAKLEHFNSLAWTFLLCLLLELISVSV